MKSAQYYHLKTFQKTKMCFHKLSEKSSMLTHNLATDKLKNLSKNHKKNKSAKCLQKVCIFNNKSAKIKKASLQKSLQKVCIFIKCNNKSAKIKKQAWKKAAKSLHIQKWKQVCIFKKDDLRIFLISQAKIQFKSAYFNIIIFPFLEIDG